MFYRHNKTCGYQFCNSKHFLKAENSEDSFASLCEEYITQYETGLLLELNLDIYNWSAPTGTTLNTRLEVWGGLVVILALTASGIE